MHGMLPVMLVHCYHPHPDCHPHHQRRTAGHGSIW
jgi:hypothetical protein